MFGEQTGHDRIVHPPLGSMQKERSKRRPLAQYEHILKCEVHRPRTNVPKRGEEPRRCRISVRTFEQRGVCNGRKHPIRAVGVVRHNGDRYGLGAHQVHGLTKRLVLHNIDRMGARLSDRIERSGHLLQLSERRLGGPILRRFGLSSRRRFGSWLLLPSAEPDQQSCRERTEDECDEVVHH